MNTVKKPNEGGFSLIELLISVAVMLIVLAVASGLFGRALGVRARESRKTDALTSAQAALSVMSREIGNAGFGISDPSDHRIPNNGIIVADSNWDSDADGKSERIHIRSNFDNVGEYTLPSGSTILSTNRPGEDVTYFFDSATNSIVRYDPNTPGTGPKTSVIVNRISNVTFEYFDYVSGSAISSTPTAASTNTGRVRITVTVKLDPVIGQPDNQTVTFSSDVTLRNSNYMLYQY